VTLEPGTITTLARAVREGRVTATALVVTSIERIEGATVLNVLSEATFDEALQAAERLDRGETDGGALSGIPTLIKDLEDLAGHSTRKGSLALSDVAPALSNAVVPSRLLAAGAVVVGKSTLPEFAIEGYTANLVTGVTRNPWNLDYSPGGSSGGSAAAVAAGLVGVATATDGGGSVRIPASLCGLVGLKPTNGAIGRWPAPDWIDYSTDGPFATSSDDLRLLFEVMRGPVAGDPTSPPLLAPGSVPVRHLLAAERTSPFGPLSPAVTQLFHDAVGAFADRFRLPVRWLEPSAVFEDGDPDLDWFTVTAPEHVSALGREWVLEHMDQFHVATQEFLGAGLDISIDGYLAARRRRYHYVRRLDQLLDRGGLLLTPTVAAEGWLADGRMSASSDVHGLAPDVYSTALQNITGHPALTVPYGHLPSGLPFGLQATAERYHDERLLDVAAIFESGYPWPRTAPNYESLDAILDLV
jgi:amidase/aspartyl-tRNA(Asn)/glutamyl-tRNA(Gln) amidotransferase subunit A